MLNKIRRAAYTLLCGGRVRRKPEPETTMSSYREQDETTTDAGLVCGCQIQHDDSGQGHNWRDVVADDIPAPVREEIEGEIIDGGKDECADFRASNGEHYRW
jgi:hypothetical protein